MGWGELIAQLELDSRFLRIITAIDCFRYLDIHVLAIWQLADDVVVHHNLQAVPLDMKDAHDTLWIDALFKRNLLQ